MLLVSEVKLTKKTKVVINYKMSSTLFITFLCGQALQNYLSSIPQLICGLPVSKYYKSCLPLGHQRAKILALKRSLHFTINQPLVINDMHTTF